MRNCSFENSIHKDNNGANVLFCDNNYQIDALFESCKFINCGNDLNQIILKIDRQDSTIRIINCSFSFDSSVPSKVIDTDSTNVIIKDSNFTKTGVVSIGNVMNAQSIRSLETTNEVIITGCKFDSCTMGNDDDNDASSLIVKIDKPLIFEDNIFCNVKGQKSGNQAMILIDLNKYTNEIELRNIEFVNNTCFCKYGGGSGINIKDVDSISFYNCSFINNEARQCASPRSSRFADFPEPYYNGDGGGIQIGFDCYMNEVDILFDGCVFKKNRAARHGGALAIQTLKTAVITNCIFEQNEANFQFPSSSELLTENHYHKKTDGRGGAIYINPAFYYVFKDTNPCYNLDSYLTNATITGCTFSTNSAHDGYAMYIEGDDKGTQFYIEDNNFIDNYNGGDTADNDVNITVRGDIATEIHSVSEDVTKQNSFSNSLSHHKKLVYVDHYGNRIPTNPFSESNDFTYSQQFSVSDSFSESDKFTLSNAFSYSNNFTHSYSFSDSNDFTHSSSFSDSNDFTHSSSFSGSNEFTNSNEFLPSNKFSPSDKFSESQDFSNSIKFTKSDLFSLSNNFTKSENFLPSNQFSKSIQFNPSEFFSKTNLFSHSNYFSKSDLFLSQITFYHQKILQNLIISVNQMITTSTES